MSERRISSFTSWQPLEEVIVGRAYPPDYFDFIEDEQVRQQLQLILAETQEDLDNLARTIESFGARVLRPDLIDRKLFLEKQLIDNGAPLPPLTPRDWQITLGQTLLRVLSIPEMDSICRDLATTNPDAVMDPYATRFDGSHVLTGASASCIVRVGRDIFFDNSNYLNTQQTQWIINNVLGSDYRCHEAVTDGHGDAVFAILKPGVILSSYHDCSLDLDRDFPGWEVLRLDTPSIQAIDQVNQFKSDNFNGRWYVQTDRPSKKFANFVDTYLQQWTGFVSETVFDVNCLVLDESHVIFSNYNRQVFDYCNRHRIEPIICDLRHRYFWDGGISCCTQDIRRRGGLETYL